MAWTRPELIEWVQARIDEIAPLEQTATIPENIIGRELDESALQILRKAKKQLVYPAALDRSARFCLLRYKSVAQPVGDPVNVPTSVVIPLNGDFIRFLRLKLRHWTRPVDDMVGTDANMYRHQYNQYQTATTSRPVAAIIPFSLTVGNTLYTQAIEAFPPPAAVPPYPAERTQDQEDLMAAATAKGVIAVFNEVPTTSLMTDYLLVEKSAAETMPDSLVDPMIWLAAGRCLTSLRLPDLAKSAYDNYQFVLNELLVGMKGEEVPVVPRK